jgi:SAM-dependent methyltransferase
MGFSRFLDRIDRRLCRAGILKAATWESARRPGITRLYAGGLDRGLPQFHTHLGLTPFEYSTRNIRHDLRQPMPLADKSVDVFQSEDVFEHIPYADLPPIIDEIFRVLKPGGLFRLSVPDYRCDILRDRSIKDDAGNIVFDPGGGGGFENGKVIDGGHLWFPVYETVKALLEQSSFARNGTVDFLHYTAASGESMLSPIDYSLGHIQRTPDHDDRVQSPRRCMSLVVDARRDG